MSWSKERKVLEGWWTRLVLVGVIKKENQRKTMFI